MAFLGIDLMIPEPGRDGRRPASIASRAFAFTIDSAILALPLITTLAVDIDLLTLDIAANALVLLYFVISWSWAGAGRTIGMRVMGIRVLRPDGSRVGLGRALLRYVALTFSFMLLGAPLLMAVFDEQHRALHDRVGDTLVTTA